MCHLLPRRSSTTSRPTDQRTRSTTEAWCVWARPVGRSQSHLPQADLSGGGARLHCTGTEGAHQTADRRHALLPAFLPQGHRGELSATPAAGGVRLRSIHRWVGRVLAFSSSFFPRLSSSGWWSHDLSGPPVVSKCTCHVVAAEIDEMLVPVPFPPHACPVGDTMISVGSRCKNV